MTEIKSPCVKKCNYNYREKICSGCHRTIQEIMAWPSLSNKEKELVLQKVTERKDKTV
ncbi:MAG: DUF1289 domain-containing protein, partial [Flavobacterium sp.]|nr:DUF1289 domain-containing protein [Flavobacterium sp.]